MSEALTIRELRARPVSVPLARPLQTSGGAVRSAPLVLLDLVTEQGLTGRSYVFCYQGFALQPMAALLRNFGALLVGADAAPLALEQRLQAACKLLGPQGLTGMALAGIDMAAWDAQALAAGLPLARLLGGACTPQPAYNSNGLGLAGAEAAADEALELLQPGFEAIKLRLGYPDWREDLAVATAVRKALPDSVTLMSDYNQFLLPAAACERAVALRDCGLYWIEEPVRADDYDGCAQVRAVSPVAIQIGENCWGPHDMARALAAGACDLFMPDAVKIGGVSGWLRAAALAHSAGLPLSSHLFPEFSAHLLAVTPTAHYLEYVDWAAPVLRQPLALDKGTVTAPDVPGAGLDWDEDAVRRYAA